MRTDQRAFPVVENGRLLGIVCLEDARRIDPSARATHTVRTVMTPVHDLTTATPEEASVDALRALSQRGVNQLPVVKDGAVRGLIRREDILKWLALHAWSARSWGRKRTQDQSPTAMPTPRKHWKSSSLNARVPMRCGRSHANMPKALAGNLSRSTRCSVCSAAEARTTPTTRRCSRSSWNCSRYLIQRLNGLRRKGRKRSSMLCEKPVSTAAGCNRAASCR
ncbi:MAG: CBS domain-containing protein [Armatimonadota bacterium]